MSAETVAGGTVVDREEDEERCCLSLFENIISVDICFPFLDYRPLIGNDNIEEMGVMQHAGLDAWVVTVLTFLEQRKRMAGTNRKCVRRPLQVMRARR